MNFPTNNQIVINALNTRKNISCSLFSETGSTPYWRLSDLAILYPDSFNVTSPVSKYTINKINSNVLEHIPEFHNLTSQPIHVLTLHESYNAYNKELKEIKTVKRGINQKLTPVACEYLFRQIKGAELEQAYFLYKDKSVTDLTIAAKELEFERVRDQISCSTSIISAIINRAHGATKNSFSEIWSLMWRKMFCVNNLNELNLKSSPLDYMTQNTLTFMNGKFQETILYFCNRADVSVNEIKDYIATQASIIRATFARYGSTPEEQLLDKSSYNRIVKTRNDRIKFWQQEYPLSLQQR